MKHLYRCISPKCGHFAAAGPDCPFCGRYGVKVRSDIETTHYLVPAEDGLIPSKKMGDRFGEWTDHKVKVVCDPKAASIRVEVRIDPRDVNCPKCKASPEWQAADKSEVN